MPSAFARTASTVFALAFHVAASDAQTIDGVQLPRILPLSGQELELAACGERTALWFDLYAVALYLPRGELREAAIRSPYVAKAVLLFPTYGGELPEEIPNGWQVRLEGTVPPDQLELFERVFARMSSDDVGTVTYQPHEGTVLRINGEVVGRTEDGQLMHGVLGIWEDPDYPVDLDLGEC